MSSYLLDSIAKGAQVGTLGRKSYDARVKNEQEAQDRAARGELAIATAELHAPREASRETNVQAPAIAAPAASPATALPEPDATEMPAAASAVSPEFDALKQDVAKQSQRKRLTTEDWAERRLKLLAAAAKTKDPNAVAAASKMLTDVQHEGFMRNLTMGQVFMANGQMEQAKNYLEDAYEYFPDDSVGEFAITPDRQSILLKPKRESTGETLPMVVLDKDTIGKMLNNMKDPARFAQWNWEQKATADQRAIDNTRADRTDTRLEKADARAATAHSAAMDKAKVELAEAKRKYGPNSVESREAEAKLRTAEAQMKVGEMSATPDRLEAANRTAMAAAETAELNADKAREYMSPENVALRNRESTARAKRAQTSADLLQRSLDGRLTKTQALTAMAQVRDDVQRAERDLTEAIEAQRHGMGDPADIDRLNRDIAAMRKLEEHLMSKYQESSAIPAPGASAPAPSGGHPADVNAILKKHGITQ